jgi:hypothetical protein
MKPNLHEGIETQADVDDNIKLAIIFVFSDWHAQKELR